MKRYLVFILGIFFIFILDSCKEQQQESFVIKRGTNISHWLSQSNRRGEERKEFFTEKDMDLIAEVGFDHIRLPIDEEQMWDEDGQKIAEAFDLMHNAITWAIDRNLRVIVDLHIIRSHHFNQGDRPLWGDPGEQDKFILLWRDLSGELGKYPVAFVAYEIMNEAVTDNPDNWNKLIAKTHKAIRETEPDRKIVIGSNMWQSVNTFPDLVIPEDDENIILSFHFYHPMVLTHYKASWTPVGKYEGPVNYPGQVVPESVIDTLTGNLKQEVAFWGGNYNIDSMRIQIKTPLDYAKNHQLPLYCGEFGCLPTVAESSRLAWYSDFRTALEENNIAWANWDYKGGFGIVSRDMIKNEALIYALLSD